MLRRLSAHFDAEEFGAHVATWENIIGVVREWMDVAAASRLGFVFSPGDIRYQLEGEITANTEWLRYIVRRGPSLF